MTKDIALFEESIKTKIHTIKGFQVILDEDLAKLYEVETGNLNRAVRRNKDRFPEDFMFQLTEKELKILKCKNGISSLEHGGRRTLPYVFTEHGVTALSGILKSKKAIEVNIQIIRAFVSMRKFIKSNIEIFSRLESFEKFKIESNEKF